MLNDAEVAVVESEQLVFDPANHLADSFFDFLFSSNFQAAHALDVRGTRVVAVQAVALADDVGARRILLFVFLFGLFYSVEHVSALVIDNVGNYSTEIV